MIHILIITKYHADIMICLDSIMRVTAYKTLLNNNNKKHYNILRLHGYVFSVIRGDLKLPNQHNIKFCNR